MPAETRARPALFADWKLATLWGATPRFAWPGLSARARLPEDMWPALWPEAIGVAEALAVDNEALGSWTARLRDTDKNAADFDPLLAGWRALMVALGLPDYPAATTIMPDGKQAWNVALPYPQIAALALELLRTWLELAGSASGRESIALSAGGVAKWRDGFARLQAALPAAEIAGLHHALWESGVVWTWQGGTRTVIGEGVRRQVIEGAGDAGPWRDTDDWPDRWRVPSYTVTGSIGKTTTTRLLRQLLADSGARIATADSDGVWIGDERLYKGDSIGGTAGFALQRDPRVEALVLEQGRAGILRHGVPLARSDVGVLLNIGEVHLGLEGVETLDQLADVKALGLASARVAVLNHDDPQCRRIGAARAADSVVWFSLIAPPGDLRALSQTSRAAAGIERDAGDSPRALALWQDGDMALRLDLAGVAPFHGLLGEKTLEELLAATCAAWVGPLPVRDWPARLRALRLDAGNHAFRASLHRRGDVLFVLDKAGEDASAELLAKWIDDLASREGVSHRIMLVTRSAADIPEAHKASIRPLHPVFDEFACFDRLDTYETPQALPIYGQGGIPVLLRDEFLRLSAEAGDAKPACTLGEWPEVEAWLDRRLAELPGKVLVLVNQSATNVTDLNDAILAYVSRGGA